MLLAIDIGNTSMSFGVFKGKKLIKAFRVSSRLSRLSYNKVLADAGRKNGVLPKDITAAIICSVVPNLILRVDKAVKWLFGVSAIIVGKHVEAPIRNNYRKPEQVGQDRLVDAVAAKEIYGAPVIIVDSGTAITFDYVSAKGEYEGGIIVPGIDISLKALYERTALLPFVKLRDDKGLALVGKDTASSIKSGILNGFGSLADGVINRIRDKHGRQITVVGTGGYIEFIKKYSTAIDKTDEFLTLKGLQIIYEKMRNQMK